MSPPAVKARLDALIASGGLKRIQAIPDVSCFGLERTLLTTRMTERASERLKEKIGLFEFVETTHHGRTYYPQWAANFVSIVLLHREDSDLERKVRLVQEVVGDFPILHRAKFATGTGAADLPRKCRQVLAEIIRDPFVHVSDLATATGLSRKTVHKYLGLLMERQGFYLQPAFDSSKIEGALLFVVSGRIDEAVRDSVEAEFKEALKEHYLIFERHYPDLLVAACWSVDFHEVKECYARLLYLSRLRKVMVLFPFETIANPSVRYT